MRFLVFIKYIDQIALVRYDYNCLLTRLCVMSSPIMQHSPEILRSYIPCQIMQCREELSSVGPGFETNATTGPFRTSWIACLKRRSRSIEPTETVKSPKKLLLLLLHGHPSIPSPTHILHHTQHARLTYHQGGEWVWVWGRMGPAWRAPNLATSFSNFSK
ncbi:uncharacterized protein BO88DRAFT_110368 [Aspergillus vadensis CBS 113365]|uniref:Uncharacterized protein n=1 Tax=Aspergillus vadensis (strain CBS 113365 / IMI 142717 / IBT 24658) TaxID=1448311 RepID=A0A319CFA6_ASPVC|nr:hypothetical protein BO88DRAFT_110368 [Aspergillus vadensis CBS 113365]PYH73998.1 hypothetical protein BO88DRAFT_110368 [Aspergillus vadensis CBS 113365]